jgi:hypothetical protein
MGLIKMKIKPSKNLDLNHQHETQTNFARRTYMIFFNQLSVALLATGLISWLWSWQMGCAFIVLGLICLMIIASHFRTWTGQDLHTCKCGKVFEWSGIPMCEDCFQKLSQSISKRTE